jgi:hypothetical protein
MSTPQIPYFLWDYDFTEDAIREILRGDDKQQKSWLVARLVESARFEDIWQYISLADLRDIFPQLQLKPQVRAAWEFALSVWANEPVHEC